MKCKNIECSNETDGKKLYCSLTCRNIYVNKYIRNYDKVKRTFEKNRINAKNEYEKNPNRCKECNNVIPFEKRNDNINFCNHSCSAKYSNKNRKGRYHYVMSEENKKIALYNLSKNYQIEKDLYYNEPNKCLNCGEILKFRFRNRTFCFIKCKKEYYLKIKTEFEIYKKLCKFNFNLNNYKNEFDFSLIEKYGWYKAKNNGDNVDGISRDHKFSIKEGFRRLINPLLLSHPANCELIINRKNQSKCDKCSIEIDELLENIKKIDKKYGNYYNFKIETYINISDINELYKQTI